ncbi:methyltransferase domain-containing protein [Sphingomonas sp. MAH-20]|uniref:Methyltransferase domain-containing protein n=1 Tax=Sphingomonas horti TaxID=2682842 RepID=A0A6I4IYJ3_9SPHN|nr:MULTISPECIES: class I SAM-dependent methyltransferase [Sphingomonas]MBA2918345.1 class I SAM-dependent methyltransferase [Sphingomonas sp. CGMCC 1.13658]MVO77312.1 methyltransferase domain-containing protein [Sphingomonas horti]
MTSPQIALVRMLLEGAELPETGPVAALARAHPARIAKARALIAGGLDPPGSAEAARALFDRLAVEAPEAGVALYSLGDPALLEEATAELVAMVQRWHPLDGQDVLDFGCGIGRVARAMTARGARVVGLDVSPAMIAEARRRGGDVRYLIGRGRGLDGVADASVDLMLAADSFPYLVAAGLLDAHVAEAARALRPGGSLIVFNWSYRGDLAADTAEAALLANAHGFDLLRSAERPFAIWDAAGFQLVRR